MFTLLFRYNKLFTEWIKTDPKGVYNTGTWLTQRPHRSIAGISKEDDPPLMGNNQHNLASMLPREKGVIHPESAKETCSTLQRPSYVSNSLPSHAHPFFHPNPSIPGQRNPSPSTRQLNPITASSSYLSGYVKVCKCQSISTSISTAFM